MLHKPKLLRNEWNISVLIFTVASVMLEMFIQHGLGLGATFADVGWEYTSFLGHRNQYAGFLYISTVAGLYLWQNSRKIIYPILIAIFFQNIVVTDSRNAFFSTILFFGLYFVFRKKISLRTIIILGIPMRNISENVKSQTSIRT